MKFLKNKSVALDISDYSLELVELQKNGSKITVSKMSRAKLEPGLIERGRIKDADKLRSCVKNLAMS
jgi:Tfp pilus assembly PilM family ATPase